MGEATWLKKKVLRSASVRILVSTTIFTNASSPDWPPSRWYSDSAPASPPPSGEGVLESGLGDAASGEGDAESCGLGAASRAGAGELLLHATNPPHASAS